MSTDGFGGLKSWARRLAGERGQTMVIVAVMIILFVSMLVLVIDAGNVYAQRRQTQNAADAGALAGARILANGGSVADASAAVSSYVSGNGAALVSVSCSAAAGAITGTVTVVASKQFPTFFAGAIGIPRANVQAAAQAIYGPPRELGNLMPIALSLDAYNNSKGGGTVRIWDSDQINEKTPAGTYDVYDGMRGWLYFGVKNCGTSTIENWIDNGYDGTVSVGQWINGKSGVKVPAITEFEVRKGDTVYVPIYDTWVKGKGQNDDDGFHIVSFAAFVVDGFVSKGNDKYVFGHFAYTIEATSCCGTVDTGVHVVYLQR